MNWYRFKIELLAVATGTALLTLSALVLMTFNADPAVVAVSHPLWVRPFLDHGGLVFTGFSLAIVLLWLCRWQTLRFFRGRQAYETR